MFSLKNNLKFITINQDYLKYLHKFCGKVYYKPTGYETKPYIGILVQENNSYKASKLYEKQITMGKIVKFCCDFKLLEEKCRDYKKN